MSALSEGFALQVSEETFPPTSRGPIFRVTLHISRSHGSIREVKIATECSPRGGNLGVFPVDPGALPVPWAQEHGYQRAWVLQSLRDQVVAFIGG